jgi:hypothetical protein
MQTTELLDMLNCRLLLLCARIAVAVTGVNTYATGCLTAMPCPLERLVRAAADRGLEDYRDHVMDSSDVVNRIVASRMVVQLGYIIGPSPLDQPLQLNNMIRLSMSRSMLRIILCRPKLLAQCLDLYLELCYCGHLFLENGRY